MIQTDYYNKKTKDLITLNTPPLESGNDPSPVNAGSVINRGFEFSLEYRNKIGRFFYDIDVNLSSLHNESQSGHNTPERCNC